MLPNDQTVQPMILCLPDGRPAPSLMSKKQVIDYLRLENKTAEMSLDRMRKEQGLRAVQVGACVRFRLADVEAFLDERQRENPR